MFQKQFILGKFFQLKNIGDNTGTGMELINKVWKISTPQDTKHILPLQTMFKMMEKIRLFYLTFR